MKLHPSIKSLSFSGIRRKPRIHGPQPFDPERAYIEFEDGKQIVLYSGPKDKATGLRPWTYMHDFPWYRK